MSIKCKIFCSRVSEGYKLRSDEQILETQSGNKFFFLCLNFSSLCLNSQDSVKLENNDSLQHLNLKDPHISLIKIIFEFKCKIVVKATVESELMLAALKVSVAAPVKVHCTGDKAHSLEEGSEKKMSFFSSIA